MLTMGVVSRGEAYEKERRVAGTMFSTEGGNQRTEAGAVTEATQQAPVQNGEQAWSSSWSGAWDSREVVTGSSASTRREATAFGCGAASWSCVQGKHDNTST